MSFTITVTVTTETAHQNADVKKHLLSLLKKESAFFSTYGVSILHTVKNSWEDKTYINQDEVLCMLGLDLPNLVFLKKFKNFPTPINGTYSKGDLHKWMEENPDGLK